MRRTSRLGAALLLLASTTGGCLGIAQGPCEAGSALCAEGSVWVCRDDGSGWDQELRCPGECQDGECVLEPIPEFDIQAGGGDAGTSDDVAGGTSGDAEDATGDATGETVD